MFFRELAISLMVIVLFFIALATAATIARNFNPIVGITSIATIVATFVLFWRLTKKKDG